jgi:alpha-tubulin suppressor-like RCC1 family protein
VAWGDNERGQTNVPAGLTNAVGIAAGVGHTLALRSDGTVVAWGNNEDGQTNVPPGLSNIVAIASGDWHCMALSRDGTVTAWGYNGSGQTNVPLNLNRVVAIAAGAEQSLALNAPLRLNVVTNNSLQFLTFPNRSYQILRSARMNPIFWTNHTIYQGTGELITVTTGQLSVRDDPESFYWLKEFTP